MLLLSNTKYIKYDMTCYKSGNTRILCICVISVSCE